MKYAGQRGLSLHGDGLMDDNKVIIDKPVNWIKVLIYCVFYIAVVMALAHMLISGLN